jgi:hypothetical protein
MLGRRISCNLLTIGNHRLRIEHCSLQPGDWSVYAELFPPLGRCLVERILAERRSSTLLLASSAVWHGRPERQREGHHDATLGRGLAPCLPLLAILTRGHGLRGEAKAPASHGASLARAMRRIEKRRVSIRRASPGPISRSRTVVIPSTVLPQKCGPQGLSERRKAERRIVLRLGGRTVFWGVHWSIAYARTKPELK